MRAGVFGYCHIWIGGRLRETCLAPGRKLCDIRGLANVLPCELFFLFVMFDFLSLFFFFVSGKSSEVVAVFRFGLARSINWRFHSDCGDPNRVLQGYCPLKERGIGPAL